MNSARKRTARSTTNDGIATAMVLAAGRGTRLGDLTQQRPKPLIEVGGRTLIDRTLDQLAAAGVAKAVVNAHHLARQLEAHLDARRAPPRVTVLREPVLLETGGGVRNALSELGERPFFVVNADIVWDDGYEPLLGRLARQWRDDAMDGLLALFPTVRAHEYRGAGDFLCDPTGRLSRPEEHGLAPFVFMGVQILHPRIMARAPEGPFSLNRVYDQAIEAGRLYGLVHDGEWIDAGTPPRLELARGAWGDRRQGHLL